MRSLRLLVVLPVAAAAVVLGTASPGTAAGAKNTTYAASWDFQGPHVTGAVTGFTLTDYVTDEYYDRVTGDPTGPGRVTAGGTPCALGSSHQANISLYGQFPTWANMPVNGGSGARMTLGCTTATGEVHRLSWGVRTAKNGSFYGRDDCLTLTRTSASTFTVSASATCLAHDVVLNTRVQVVRDDGLRSLPFTAVLTATGLLAP